MHWKKFFAEHKTYFKVGRVVHVPIDPMSSIPAPCKSPKSGDGNPASSRDGENNEKVPKGGTMSRSVPKKGETSKDALRDEL